MLRSAVDDSLRRTVRSRTTKLLTAAARVGSAELGRRLVPSSTARARAKQALVVGQTLSELKGAVMKIGQLLSIDAEDVLPPEVVKVLGKLQNQAEPIDFAIVKRVIHAELGDRAERFTEIDPRPLAAASIGQVHRARAGGEDVVIKVQYPGVAESIDADIAALSKLVRTLMGLSSRSIELDEVFDELSTMLHRETNYVTERENLDRYRGMLDGEDRFIVPRSFEELSTERVLTMSYEPGPTLFEHLDRGASMAERTDIARAILDLYCIEFFREGLVQTDPNPGNFLVQDDGRIVLLDFGAAIPYSDEFRHDYVGLLRTLGTRDPRAIIEDGERMGFIDPRETDEVKLLFAEFLTLAVEPFREDLQPFEFSSEDYARRSRHVGRAFTRQLRYSPPPRELIFLHRKLGGIFNIIKRMDVRLDLGPYWNRFVD